jgi:hypothetical protein
MYFLFGKKKEVDIEKQCQQTDCENVYTKLMRKLVQPLYNFTDLTHHLFGGNEPFKTRLSPVVYGIKELVSDIGSFHINYRSLDKIGSPLISISKVYIEHENEIQKIVYNDVPIHKVFFKSRKHGNTYITEIPISGFPVCFRGPSSGYIQVKVEEVIDLTNDNDDKAVELSMTSPIKMYVEYVQSAANEDALMHKANYRPISFSYFNAARDMTPCGNCTYIHKCRLQPAYILQAIIAASEDVECLKVCAYVQKDDSRHIVNEIGGIMAATAFERDKITLVADKGYNCYTLPFTSMLVHNNFQIDNDKLIPPGAIYLNSVEENDSELIIEATFAGPLKKPPVMIAALAAFTKVYI